MICYRVQSCPGRERVRERLTGALPDPLVVVDTEDGGEPDAAGPWRGYLRCLQDLPPAGHVVVIQDDATVCRNFPQAVEQIVQVAPSQPVCLFVPGSARRTVETIRRVHRAPLTPLHLRDFMPVVGVIWPVEHARSLTEWDWRQAARRTGIRLPVRSDDAIVGLWNRETRAGTLVTVPSLVQHPDDVPSVVSARRPQNGADGGRVAAWFIGEDDPLEIVWSAA